jgi:TldD protein
LPEKLLRKAGKAGVPFADIRHCRSVDTSLELRATGVRKAVVGEEEGVSVRVLDKGAWGFASTNRLTRRELDRALAAALRMARSLSGVAGKPVTLAPVKAATAECSLVPKVDPENVDIGDKRELASDVEKAARAVAGVSSVTASYSDGTQWTRYMSTEGADVSSSVTRCLCQAEIIVREGGRAVGYRTRVGATGGFEIFRREDPVSRAGRAGKAAVRILGAGRPPRGKMTVVADPDLTGVFAHEALGHAAESDLVLSGDSILKGRLGRRIGAEGVDIIDDPTLKWGFGSFPFDDEGVKGKRKYLVRDGVLEEFITSRETAGELGLEPNGGARAEGFDSRPLVRMSNTMVRAGDHSREELIEGVKKGILAMGTRGGQVDTAKGRFQFNAQEAFLIEKGEVTRPLKDVSLTGDTLKVLHNIDALGKTMKFGSPGFCGKGQMVPVGDGGPYTRIRNVTVGGG